MFVPKIRQETTNEAMGPRQNTYYPGTISNSHSWLPKGQRPKQLVQLTDRPLLNTDKSMINQRFSSPRLNEIINKIDLIQKMQEAYELLQH